MRDNKKDHAKLVRALKLVNKLADVELDDLLSGANDEIARLRRRILNRIDWLETSDPSCYRAPSERTEAAR